MDGESVGRLHTGGPTDHQALAQESHHEVGATENGRGGAGSGRDRPEPGDRVHGWF